MFAKFGFVLLILLFGTLAFMAGAMAPDTWRHAMSTAADRWVTAVRELVTTAHPSESLAVTKKTSTPATTSPAAAASAAPPLQMGALTIKASVGAPAPAAGQPAYAIQLGQYVTSDEAAMAAKRFQALGVGLPFTQVAVVDEKNQAWTILAAGQFTTPSAAQQAANRVQSSLNLDTLPVIKLPPSTKPAS